MHCRRPTANRGGLCRRCLAGGRPPTRLAAEVNAERRGWLYAGDRCDAELAGAAQAEHEQRIAAHAARVAAEMKRMGLNRKGV